MECQRDGVLRISWGRQRQLGEVRGSVERRSHCRPTPFSFRHRACNMFLESYKATWILTEDHSFEDRMIDDLSVSWGLSGSVGAELDRAGAEAAPCTPPGVALHIEGYGKGSPWFGQNQRRVQDVREEKKIQPTRAMGRQEGTLEASPPTSTPPSRKLGSRRKRKRRWRTRSQTPCTSSSCTSAARP